MHFIRARIDHCAVVFSSIFVKNNRLTSQEHLARIRKVLDYIDQHLDDELPLEKLAEMGSYSHFHFHRIETLTHLMENLVHCLASQLRIHYQGVDLDSLETRPCDRYNYWRIYYG